MKHLLFFLLLSFVGSPLYAQQGYTPPAPKPPKCGIYFDYDAAGQRIKRSNDCRSQNQGPTLPPITEPSAIRIRFYPNPTSGPYTVEFLEPLAEPVHYHWYTPDGQILSSGVFSEQQTHGNIATWADGTYVLAVFFPEGAQALRVIKITQ